MPALVPCPQPACACSKQALCQPACPALPALPSCSPCPNLTSGGARGGGACKSSHHRAALPALLPRPAGQRQHGSRGGRAAAAALSSRRSRGGRRQWRGRRGGAAPQQQRCSVVAVLVGRGPWGYCHRGGLHPHGHPGRHRHPAGAAGAPRQRGAAAVRRRRGGGRTFPVPAAAGCPFLISWLQLVSRGGSAVLDWARLRPAALHQLADRTPAVHAPALLQLAQHPLCARSRPAPAAPAGLCSGPTVWMWGMGRRH